MNRKIHQEMTITKLMWQMLRQMWLPILIMAILGAIVLKLLPYVVKPILHDLLSK